MSTVRTLPRLKGNSLNEAASVVCMSPGVLLWGRSIRNASFFFLFAVLFVLGVGPYTFHRFVAPAGVTQGEGKGRPHSILLVFLAFLLHATIFCVFSLNSFVLILVVSSLLSRIFCFVLFFLSDVSSFAFVFLTLLSFLFCSLPSHIPPSLFNSPALALVCSRLFATRACLALVSRNRSWVWWS